MNNEIEKDYLYVSSNGSSKDVRTLENTHLINALAKCHREIYSQNNIDEYMKVSNNIANIELELLKRSDKFFNEKFGGNQ